MVMLVWMDSLKNNNKLFTSVGNADCNTLGDITVVIYY